MQIINETECFKHRLPRQLYGIWVVHWKAGSASSCPPEWGRNWWCSRHPESRGSTYRQAWTPGSQTEGHLWWSRLIAVGLPQPESVSPGKESPGRGEALVTEAARNYELQGSKLRVTMEVKNFSEKISLSQANWWGERSWEKNWTMDYK